MAILRALHQALILDLWQVPFAWAVHLKFCLYNHHVICDFECRALNDGEHMGDLILWSLLQPGIKRSLYLQRQVKTFKIWHKNPSVYAPLCCSTRPLQANTNSSLEWLLLGNSHQHPLASICILKKNNIYIYIGSRIEAVFLRNKVTCLSLWFRSQADCMNKKAHSWNRKDDSP